jgi:hypothetical protein
MQNDGTLFTVGETNLTAFLDASGVGSLVSADLVRSLYPGQNDTDVIADADRDIVFLWFVCLSLMWLLDVLIVIGHPIHLALQVFGLKPLYSPEFPASIAMSTVG